MDERHDHIRPPTFDAHPLNTSGAELSERLMRAMWDQKTLDENGGHTPECEGPGKCDETCPIRLEREAAHRQASIAWKERHEREVLALIQPPQWPPLTESEQRLMDGNR